MVPSLRVKRCSSGRTTAVLGWILSNPENRLKMPSWKALMVNLEMNARTNTGSDQSKKQIAKSSIGQCITTMKDLMARSITWHQWPLLIKQHKMNYLIQEVVLTWR